MPAIPYKKTPVNTDEAWDAGENVDHLKHNDVAAFKKVYAWYDKGADDPDDDGYPDSKSAWKFPHHFVSDDGTPGDASAKACSAGIAILNGGRGGAKIPEADRQGIYDHLAHHLRDADKEPPKLNALGGTEQHSVTFSTEDNAFTADDATSTLHFPHGQVVSDESEHRNGISYDIPSLDLSKFNGSVTDMHNASGSIKSVIGKTKLRKQGNKVVMDDLQFATRENPDAQVAYDLYKNGYARDFSTTTVGPVPDEDGKIHNAAVVGLSCVDIGNNENATMNDFKEVVRNSLATARNNGLDTTDAEKRLGVEHVEDENKHEQQQTTTNHKQDEDDDMKFVTIKNSRDFAISVKYKNAAGDETETELAPGTSVDVSEEQKEAVENQLSQAKNPAEQESAFTKAINTALEANDKKWQERFDGLEKNLLDATSQEPQFQTNGAGRQRTGRHILTNSKLEDMPWQERTVFQMENLYGMLKGDPEAAKKVWAINNLHYEQLKAEGKVDNALSITDLGNFVIPPELITQIFGHVGQYQPLLDKFSFRETLSMITSYITRTSEMDMQDVDIDSGAAGANALKSVNYPQYTTNTATLTEFASVTPVDASAIRFSAADIMQDITMQYKQAYDRALARSIIGRAELAVQSNGQSVQFDTSVSAVDGLTAMLDTWAPIVEWVPDGLFMMTKATELELMKYALQAGPNGPLANIFTRGEDQVPRFFGLQYVVVPTQVMPSLNLATRGGALPQFTFEGETVTVQHSILLARPENFIGRVSGGLQFQVSTEAAYEESGVVKSAYQRDKLVFRGYGYRKSAFALPSDIAGVTAAVLS